MELKMWMTTAEVRIQPGDVPSGDVLGFMRITAWASSESEFIGRVRDFLAKYQWILLGSENTHAIDSDRDYGDEANAIIDHIRDNEDFIGLGTFYSYRPN